mmetsp:Transcript_3219/g.3687  ORF Transcript_3219/g.3687 Transcript_3219/m.3687 type:complete len:95 (-) Transcript_3219:24-308(-)
MKVDGRTIASSSSSSTTPINNQKCEKYLKPIQKKKNISLNDIGSPSNNMLLDYLYCQCKVIAKTSYNSTTNTKTNTNNSNTKQQQQQQQLQSSQ